MHLPDPVFPPLLTGHGVNAPERPFDVARSEAAAGRMGAGDFVWARDTRRLDCAIVLEPEVGRARAGEMLITAMVALGDAAGALAPPEVGVFYRWPQTIDVNGAIAGKADLAVSPRTGPDGAPDWLVVGIQLAIGATGLDPDPGYDLDHTTLWEEGCADIDRTVLIESFSRHFLAWIDTWEVEGFGPAHEIWLGRNRQGGETVTIETPTGPVTGTFVGLDETGGLLLRTDTGVAAIGILDALAPHETVVADG
ncbi:MAG: hypothetical protein KDJ77_13630 [Rhodobiaceae bacterium]|nr:hypothetical protein [Rhodobiaceae bacterium]